MTWRSVKYIHAAALFTDPLEVGSLVAIWPSSTYEFSVSDTGDLYLEEDSWGHATRFPCRHLAPTRASRFGILVALSLSSNMVRWSPALWDMVVGSLGSRSSITPLSPFSPFSPSAIDCLNQPGSWWLQPLPCLFNTLMYVGQMLSRIEQVGWFEPMLLNDHWLQKK